MSIEQAPAKLHDIDFQLKVMKLLATNIVFANKYSCVLKEEYFENKIHSTLFSLIKNHVLLYEREASKSDLMVKVNEFCIEKNYDESIVSTFREETNRVFQQHIGSEEFILNTIDNFIDKQAALNVLTDLVQIYETGTISLGKMASMCEQASSQIYHESEGASFQDLLNLPEKYREQYSKDKLVSTGFVNYDKYLGGGLGPRELHVVMAAPKTGKSTFGTNVGAFAAATGKTVFHVTLEISVLDVLAKYAVKLTDLTYEEIGQQFGQNNEYLRRLEKHVKNAPNLFVNYWSPNTIDALHIRSWISHVRSQKKVQPDLIIIDYDDMLLPTDKSLVGDMYGRAGGIYTDLKNLADHFEVPCLTFAQPRRDAWYKDDVVTADELAHSAKKAHFAHSISSLNFSAKKDTGSLYLDMIRRGEGGKTIPLMRDLRRGKILEANAE